MVDTGVIELVWTTCASLLSRGISSPTKLDMFFLIAFVITRNGIFVKGSLLFTISSSVSNTRPEVMLACDFSVCLSVVRVSS